MRKGLLLSLALVLMSGGVMAANDCTAYEDNCWDCGKTEDDLCTARLSDTKLTITGSGAMKGYDSGTQPWGKNVTEVEMSGITEIGYRAFGGTNIEHLNIPASVTKLDNGALQTMYHLSSITFEEGSTLKTIGTAAFAGVTALQILELPDSVESMSDNLFGSSGIVSLVLPESLFKDGKIGLSKHTFKNGMTLYCPKEYQQKCENYLKTAESFLKTEWNPYTEYYIPIENITLQTYEKDGDAYFINGSWYKHPNDVLTGKHIKKLRYTVEEAMKATENGDKFHVRLTYK